MNRGSVAWLSSLTLILTGCSGDKSAVKSKALWLCKHIQAEAPNLDTFPDGEKPSDYIHPDDLAYLKAKNADNPFAALGETMRAALIPTLVAVSTAVGEHTTCEVTAEKVDGREATVTVKATSPDLGGSASSTNPLGLIGELSKLDSKAARVAKVNEVIATTKATKTRIIDLKFEKVGASWLAKYSLEAKELEQKRAAKEAADAATLARLQEEKTKADAARGELKKFEVLKSTFSVRRGEYRFEDKVMFTLTVKNGLTTPISRVFFEATLASPGRAVPWHTDDLNYDISGGIEPGETKTWSLTPNIMSGWRNVDAPKDAVLTAEVVRLDGPKGETIASSEGFSKEDAKTLEALLGSHGKN